MEPNPTAPSPAVLIADDHATGQGALARGLAPAFPGLRCELARDPESLRRALRAHRFDLVLVASRLGWAEPAAVLREAKVAQPACPAIVFLSDPATGAPNLAVDASVKVAEAGGDSPQLVELAREFLSKSLAMRAEAREGKATFIYSAQDGSISLNGKRFASNTPARILRKIVTAYVKEGKSTFQFREFKRNPEILPNRKSPNFELRLKRLAEKFSGSPVQIAKTGRGQFALQADCEIEFLET